MFIRPIVNHSQSTDRPITFTIINDLIKSGFVPTVKTDRIDYRTAIKTQRKTPGTTRSTRRSFTPEEPYLEVRNETKYFQEGSAWLRKSRYPSPPYFNDAKLGARIEPVYERVVVELTMAYRSTSLATIQEWLSRLRIYTQAGKDRNVHTLDYHVNLHDDVHTWLKAVYDRREGNYGYGEEYGDYVANHLRDSAVAIHAGSSAQMAISEKQTGVEGYLQEPFVPDIEEISDGVYGATVRYQYTYRRPSGTIQRTPVLIHQQAMELKYLSIVEVRDRGLSFDQSPLIRSFKVPKGNAERFMDFRVPCFDVEPLPRPPSTYSPLVTVLVAIESEEPHVLFNLTDLQDATLHGELLKVFRENDRTTLLQEGRDLFYIALLKNQFRMTDGMLEIDDALNVHVTSALDGRSTYRVVLYMNTHIKLFNESLLAKYDRPRLVEDLSKTINHFVRNRADKDFRREYIIPTDFKNPLYLQRSLPVIDKSGRVVPYIGNSCDVKDFRRGKVNTSRAITLRTVQQTEIQVGRKGDLE